MSHGPANGEIARSFEPLRHGPDHPGKVGPAAARRRADHPGKVGPAAARRRAAVDVLLSRLPGVEVGVGGRVGSSVAHVAEQGVLAAVRSAPQDFVTGDRLGILGRSVPTQSAAAAGQQFGPEVLGGGRVTLDLDRQGREQQGERQRQGRPAPVRRGVCGRRPAAACPSVPLPARPTRLSAPTQALGCVPQRPGPSQERPVTRSCRRAAWQRARRR